MNRDSDLFKDADDLDNAENGEENSRLKAHEGGILLYAPTPAPAAALITILEAEGHEVYLARDLGTVATFLDSAPARLLLAIAPAIGKDLIASWKATAPAVEIRVISGISQLFEQHIVPQSELLDFTVNSIAAASSFIAKERNLPQEQSYQLLELCERAADQLGFGLLERATVRVNAAFLFLGRALSASEEDDRTVLSRPKQGKQSVETVITHLADGLGCPFMIGRRPGNEGAQDQATPFDVVQAAHELMLLLQAETPRPADELRRKCSGGDSGSQGDSDAGLSVLHPAAVEAVLNGMETTESQKKGVIVVIDNDPAFRSLISLRLANEGYSVRTYANGRRALEAICDKPPLLILSETILPGLDGFSLLDNLKQSGLQQVPFLFVSSRSDPTSMNKGLLLGANDYLTKPVNPEILLTKVQKNLGDTVAPLDASARLSLADLEGATPGVTIYSYEELRVGILINDRFRITSDLGEGGMGRVFQAEDEKLEETVVLKVMKSSLSSNDRALRHFKSEIRLARRITHPGVVRIFDFWESGPLKFVTMEYLDGENLRDLIRSRGSFPLPIALRIAAEFFDALAVAHEVGVVHRDIKPHNLLMTGAGKIKILDFGIAQGLDPEGREGATITSAIMGTPEYMSPEQLNGSRVDARTDLYSAGLVLYEMLTEKLPFSGDNRMVLATKRLHTPPTPPSRVNDQIPEEVERILMRLLELDLSKRYQTAREVLSDLKKLDQIRR